MNLEIERKYIVNRKMLNLYDNGSNIIQGYFSNNDRSSIRVRRKDRNAYITIKSGGSNMVRAEFEYSIDLSDAKYMLDNLCLYSLINKTRYEIIYHHHLWIVDIFKAENTGLVLAEIELKSKNEKFDCPNWLQEEVTNNTQYYNYNLAKHPFSTWNTNYHHCS